MWSVEISVEFGVWSVELKQKVEIYPTIIPTYVGTGIGQQNKRLKTLQSKVFQ